MTDVRVTFLTGCLEPGRDGVGDYTRLLARECTGLGARCQILALADQYVASPVSERLSGVEFTRLPPGTSRRAMFDTLREAVRSFGSDWVSLQFVPYSFHRWGMPAGLARDLPETVKPARLQVMLHEIWISGHGPWRRRLVRAGQQRCVRALCRRTGTLVHTSSGTYQRELASHGIAAGRLPLFGNVPVVQTDAMRWLGAMLAAIGCNAAERRSDWWLFVLFGTIHPEWPPEPLLSRLQEAAAASSKRIAIVSVGRLGIGEPIWAGVQARHGTRVPMLRLSEQPVEQVSELLNTVNFGIATSPYALLEKSGTVTAMLEHGLPVIVNREDQSLGTAIALDPDDVRQVIRMDHDLAGRLSTATRRPPQSRLPAVARQFLADLDNCTIST